MKFSEMMTKIVKGPTQKKVELSLNMKAARQSYLDVENFVLNFMKNHMPDIITLTLESSQNKDGENLYFVSWSENISGSVFKFSSEPIFDFSDAMSLYESKEMVMDK
jgi:hypothetical protein